MTNKDYSTILFPPDRVSQLTTAFLKQRRETAGRGIPVGLTQLDKKFIPLMPTELCSIVGRPGNGKTGFMVRWARDRAAWLRKNDLGDKRLVIYLTLEQSIEELNAFNIAADERLSITSMARGEITDAEWDRCLTASVDRVFLPLWNVGYSAMTDVKQVKIDLDAIEGALELARERNKREIDIVFVDYLQRMPITRAENKTVGVSDNLDGLKNIALRLKCPVVTGVQARREVDEYADHIPELDDGQWTSNIEQTSDRVISLMRPAKYFEVGKKYSGGIKLIDGMNVTKNMMLIRVLKQKLGEDNFSYLAYFDPEYNRLSEMERGEE